MRQRLAFGAIMGAAAFACGAAGQVQIYLGEYKFNDPILHVMGPGGAGVQPFTGASLQSFGAEAPDLSA